MEVDHYEKTHNHIKEMVFNKLKPKLKTSTTKTT